MDETEPILQSRRNLVGGGSVSKLGLVGRNKNKPAGNCNRGAKKRTEDEKTRQGTALATRHDNTQGGRHAAQKIDHNDGRRKLDSG